MAESPIERNGDRNGDFYGAFSKVQANGAYRMGMTSHQKQNPKKNPKNNNNKKRGGGE